MIKLLNKTLLQAFTAVFDNSLIILIRIIVLSFLLQIYYKSNKGLFLYKFNHEKSWD